MNIQFNSLEINDFQSIGNAKVELDNKGTCLVKGINNYEENTTSNGSGKSSIFEALYFSLFGKTTTGLTNVSNRYTGNTYKLVLDFILDDVKYQIIRDGTKVTVLQDGTDISRKNKLDTDTFIRDNILKISPEVFLNIIYLAQGFKSRLSALTAGGRKDQIEEIIGTNEITEEFRLQLQKLKEKLQSDQNDLLTKKSYNEGSLTQINSNIEQYQLEIDRILKERESQPSKEDIMKQRDENKKLLEIEGEKQIEITKIINQIKEENSTKQLQFSNLEKEVLDYSVKIQTAKSSLNNKILEYKNQKSQELNDLTYKLSEDLSKLSEENTILDVENTNYDYKIKDNNKQIEVLKTSEVCPTCGRKFDDINHEHLESEIKRLENEISEINKSIVKNVKKEDENNKKIQEIKDKIEENKTKIQNEINEYESKVEEQINILNNTFNEFAINKDSEKKALNDTIKDFSNEEHELSLVNSNIALYKQNISKLEEELQNIKEESTKNYENLIKECKIKLTKLNKENEKYEKQISEKEEKINVATHSISLVTKEFKNYLLKSAIEFLNLRLEYYSALLFSNEEDKVKFIQEGTKLDIYLGDALFESLSGGEKRKVDIAIMLVQKELANNMSNTYSNILILDECMDGLDSKSIDIVTNVLLQVSKDINSMFIVSHKDTTIGYDSQIIVIKGKNRISTIESY